MRELEARYRETLNRAGDFWQRVESDEHLAKHPRPGECLEARPANTTAVHDHIHIANTFIRSSSHGTGDYGLGRYSAASVLVQDGSAEVSLDDYVQRSHRYWGTLVGALYG